MAESRKTKSMKNMVVGLVLLIANYLMTFVYRKFFLTVLNLEYLGSAGLVNSVISVLSLTELGISVSITFFLYKPLSEGNEEKISAIIRFIRRVYLLIALITLAIGLIILPFLHVFIKDELSITPSIRIVYLFYLFGSVTSYLAGPKTILLTADQKDYINKIVVNSTKILSQCLILILLIATSSYFTVLIIDNMLALVHFVLLTIIVNKQYPFIKKIKVLLTKDEKAEIYKYTGCIFFSKLGSVIVTSSANIIISTFIGVIMVGIYQNYYVLIMALGSIITILFTSLSASLGNFVVKESLERQKELFRALTLLNAWIATFATIGLYFVSSKFIAVWLGSEYLMDNSIVAIIAISFYLECMARVVGMFNGSMGLAPKVLISSIIYPIVNLASSIILVNLIGLSGVFISTIIARLSVMFYENWVVNNYALRFSTWQYYKYILYYTALFLVAGGLTYLASLIPIQNLKLALIYSFAICTIIPNAIFFLGSCRLSAFKNLIGIMPSRIRRIFE